MRTVSPEKGKRKGKDQWMESLVELLQKQLRGEELSPEEIRRLEAAEALERLSPGELANAILCWAFAPLAPLRQNADAAAPDAMPAYRVAAASLDKETALYDEVCAAIAKGSSSVERDLGRGPVPLLAIDAERRLVEPRFQEGFVFTVQRRDGTEETIGPVGGVFLNLDELREMTLIEDADRKTIRLVPTE